MRWPFGPPHLTLKPSKQKNKNKTNLEGLGPSEVALRATSHDPKKPSKKKHKKKQQTKKTKKEIKREKQQEKTKNTQK